MTQKLIKVPDLGGVEKATLIEWLVSVGQDVDEETPLATLESEKASMDIPSPHKGKIAALHLKVGDVAGEGDHLLDMVIASEEQPAAQEVLRELVVPDLGGIESAKVIELLVQVGETITEEAGLLTLESEKASMDVPSAFTGELISLNISVGDVVKEGHLIGMLRCSDDASAGVQEETPHTFSEPPAPTVAVPVVEKSTDSSKSSPIVRRLAWELDIDLGQITGTGKRGRITKQDLLTFIKSKMQGGGPKPIKLPNFADFGEAKLVELGKIKRFSGPFLQQAWQTIPHVTHFFEADFTELEAFRSSHKKAFAAGGARLTPILFFIKALIPVLREFPTFAASLSEDGQSLWLKDYLNIGIAVDTPNGLVVPVIRDVDQKSLVQIAKELIAVSEQARDKGLSPQQMQGGVMTISSLGGIGGVAFTPIINAPEVCILGISKGYMKPVYDGETFEPRYVVPLSLSYDHRVIDGAEAARFCARLQAELENMHETLTDADMKIN